MKSPCQGSSIIAHERLAIVDPDSGDQPLFNEALEVGEVGMEPRGMWIRETCQLKSRRKMPWHASHGLVSLVCHFSISKCFNGVSLCFNGASLVFCHVSPLHEDLFLSI